VKPTTTYRVRVRFYFEKEICFHPLKTVCFSATLFTSKTITFNSFDRVFHQ